MCFKLLGLVRMITDLPNRAYPNDGVKFSLFACISFNTSCLQNTYYQMNENIFFSICNMFGKIHFTYCACMHTWRSLGCSPSTKQVTRKGMELHLQSNSFQMKRTQVLELITTALCLRATHSNSTRREREDSRLEETTNCEGISESVT